MVAACGTILRRTLNVQQDSCTVACDREYLLFIPCVVGTRKASSSSSSSWNDSSGPPSAVSTTVDTLPVVIAFHGFGASMSTMSFWTRFAELFGFVFVAPNGYMNSWNGQQCCGQALAQNVDDAGFIQAILRELRPPLLRISVDHVFALGHSNGGFVITTPKVAPLFRAIAPMAGFADHHSVTTTAATTTTMANSSSVATKTVAMFMHQSRNDPVVQITGCCTDENMPRCCCEISDHKDICTAIPTKVHSWATQINHCDNDESPTVSWQVPDVVTCYTYNQNCQANTTYCIHQDLAHFLPFSHFPYHDQIAHFFARHACAGIWDPATYTCTDCPEGLHGRFCLSTTALMDNSLPAADLTKKQAKTQRWPEDQDDTLLDAKLVGKTVTASILIVSIVVGVYLSRKLIRTHNDYKTRSQGYSKVATTAATTLELPSIVSSS